MRRIAPLAAVLAVPLMATVVGCDDTAPSTASRETIALGTLPPALATAPPTSGTAPEPAPQATDATTTTDRQAPERPDATSDDGAGSGAGPSDEPTSSTDPGSAPTRFVTELDGLVEDDAPTRLATSTLRDDTGRLGVDVPRDWSDHRTAPSRLADGGETPSLAAAPALTSFLDGFDAPGLTALVVGDEPGEALDAYAFAEDCTDGRAGAYRGDDAEGRYEVWESCGGTINDIVTVAVRPADADETVLLLVQVVTAADLAALDAALESLELRP
jgi:hypothetical protein